MKVSGSGVDVNNDYLLGAMQNFIFNMDILLIILSLILFLLFPCILLGGDW